MKKQNLIASVVIIIIAVGLGIYLMGRSVEPRMTKESTQEQVDMNSLLISFECDADKTLDVVFDVSNEDSIDVSLSDGRQMTLPALVFEGVTHYGTEDGSLLFLSDGDLAMVVENEEVTYANCAVATVSPSQF